MILPVNNYNNKNLNFGNHTLCIDIGASKFKLASMKTRLLLDNTADTFFKTTVFSSSKNKRNSKTFIEAIARRIIKIEKKNADKIKQFDPDGALDVIIDVPGPYIEDKVFIPNILQNNNEPIGTIDINLIPEILRKKGVKLDKFVPVNAAAGGCVLSKIEKTHPELLVEGTEIFYLYPGGGLGSGSIIIDRAENKIVPLEIQHVKAAFSNKSIEAEGGCATSLVNNYLEFLENKISSNLYNSIKESKNLSANTVTRANPPAQIKKGLIVHKMASKYAMDKFIDCIAQLISIEVTGGKTKSAVLTGRTAEGIIEGVKKNPLYGEKNNALELIKERMSEHLTPMGKNLMGNDFKVLFVPLSDSTEGSDILKKSYKVGNQAWVNIPKNKN